MDKIPTMLSVDEAIEIVLAQTMVMGTERVAITDTLGKVLAEDIVSKREHPPWNNSAMDGYAVRWHDIQSANTEAPAILPIVDEVAAGGMPKQALAEGEAVSIMTGAPVPENADTVVRIEDTTREGEQVAIINAPKKGANIRPHGEDIQTGQTVISAGQQVRPAELGMLATAGHVWTQIYQQPRVSILATGNELAEPGDDLGPEKIINSNAFSVSGLANESGAKALMLHTAGDNREELTAKILEASAADIAIVVGGVSVGKYDYVKDVLKELGCEMHFWRVKMRPGHPVAFGTLKGRAGHRPTLLFGLPGNPVSCMVAFYQFVYPTLRKMRGLQNLQLSQVEAELLEDIRQRPGRRHFARALTTYDYDSGSYKARLSGPLGSGILTSMVQANSLLVLSEEHSDFKAGERVPVQILPDSVFTS
jgi:molybdopterin molybdotransferase